MRTTVRKSIDNLLEAALSGRSAALVLRSAPGIDRQRVLDRLVEAGEQVRMIKVAVVDSGQDPLASARFSWLHQLCAQVLDQLELLTPPQREVLRAAFDPSNSGPDPRFAGLAAFNLLALAAEEQPLICVIDNAHRLDRASGQALAFTARRLLDESVALLFLVDPVGEAAELAGLPHTFGWTGRGGRCPRTQAPILEVLP